MIYTRMDGKTFNLYYCKYERKAKKVAQMYLLYVNQKFSTHTYYKSEVFLRNLVSKYMNSMKKKNFCAFLL